jgi:hypothetical protein
MEVVIMRRPKFSRQAAILGLAVLIAPALAPAARAQHTPDPYNIVGEYNLGYQDYMYANYPNGIGFSPNQGVLQGRSGVSRANQFQSYIEELDGVGSGSDIPSSRGRGGIEPYYRAHRQFDESFNRIYSPNEAADKTYHADQNSRTKKYLEYLKESDPKKRAQLYREYNNERLRAARDIGSGSTRAAFRNGTADRSATSGTGAGTSGTGTGTSSTPPARRPSSLPTPPARSRVTPPLPDLSTETTETPQQILDRAEARDRANRSALPSRVPPRTAPR